MRRKYQSEAERNLDIRARAHAFDSAWMVMLALLVVHLVGYVALDWEVNPLLILAATSLPFCYSVWNMALRRRALVEAGEEVPPLGKQLASSAGLGIAALLIVLAVILFLLPSLLVMFG